MDHDIPAETLNTIADLLCNNDKAGAILVYYRASDKPLEQSWEAIQHILIDLGEDVNSLPEQAEKDLSYSVVQYYFKGAIARYQENLPFMVAFLLFLALSFVMIVPRGIKVVNEIRSWSWPSTDATVVSAKSYPGPRTTRPPYTSTTYTDFTFRYKVEGQEYTDSRRRDVILSDKIIRSGDVLSIAYNPNNPSVTVYDGELGIIGILAYTLAIALGLIPLILCIACGSVIIFMELGRKRLKRLDRQVKRLNSTIP